MGHLFKNCYLPESFIEILICVMIPFVFCFLSPILKHSIALVEVNMTELKVEFIFRLPGF